jgi:hypothetical protein
VIVTEQHKGLSVGGRALSMPARTRYGDLPASTVSDAKGTLDA